MSDPIIKFATVQVLILFRSGFLSPAILTFIATLMVTLLIFFQGSNLTLPNWLPANFSIDESDLFRWWTYAVIVFSVLENIYRKAFVRKPASNFRKKTTVTVIIFTIVYGIFLATLNHKDLIVGYAVYFYIFWYVLMLIFIVISMLFTFLIQKVELSQNTKPVS